MRKITDPHMAHSLVQDLINHDQTRANKRIKVSGMVSGNAPFDGDTLKKTGQAHRCNVNFREGEGIINARNTSFFELFLDGRDIIQCQLKDVAQYMGRGTFWEQIVTTEMKRCIKSWNGFNFEMMQLANSMNLHGDAFPMFGHNDSWKFRTFKTGEVLFPKNTKASVDYIDCAVVLDTMTIPELYQYLGNTSATQMGWNKSIIKELIENSVKKNAYDTTDWEELQRDIENNALAYEHVLTSEIKVAHILVRENDGMISHYIQERGKQADFIYECMDAYESIEEIFVPFICNIGNGYYHGVKGVGARIYPSVVINNRFLCRAVDGAMDSASMVVAFKDGTNRKGKTLRLGNQIILPPGAGLESNNLSQNLNGITQMYGLLSQVNQSSVGVKRPGLGNIAKADTQNYTARSANMQVMEEMELEKMDIALYYSQVDMLYSQMGLRILKAKDKQSKDFKKRCIEQGVPKELLTDYDAWEFRAPRGVGSGSHVMKNITTQDMLSIAPYLPELGKRAVIEDFIEARGGAESVNRYYPPFEGAKMPTKSSQIANLENNDMIEGKKSIVSVDDMHSKHLETHMPYALQQASAVLKNPKPEFVQEVMKAAPAFIEHISNHLGFIKGDKLHAKDFKQYSQQLKQLMEIVEQVQKIASAMMKEQENKQKAQQKQMQEIAQRGDQTEMQKKLMEIKAEQEFKILKEQHNHEVRVAKAKHGMEIAEAKAMNEIQLQQLKASNELKEN